ncbi:hypothetical protein C8Q75DRAFT_491521 [Abortiporus biennis]|nr:hypothetical protein C8Q75DRAFT_491521 [Abortiporus biennis]
MSSLAFINDLPPEILLKVFFQYIAAEDPGVDTNALEDDNRVRKHRGENLIHPLPPYHWIFLSHVCCYWREVSLNAPLLWSRVYITTPEWAKILLTRSGSTPLSIEARFGRRLSEQQHLSQKLDAMKLVYSNIRRITTLNLHCKQTTLTEFSEIIGTADTSSIKSITLSTDEYYDQDHTPLQFLVTHPLPNLERFTSYWFGMNALRSMLRATIKHLSIAYTEGRERPLDSLLEVLTSMPLLESLKLRWALQSVPGESVVQLTEATVTASLPHLRVLHLLGYGIACAPLLQAIQTHPDLNELFVQATAFYSTIELCLVLHAIAERLNEIVTNSWKKPLRSISFCRTPDYLRFQGWTCPSVRPTRTVEDSSSPTANVTIFFETLRASENEVFQEWCFASGFRNIYSLYLDGGFESDNLNSSCVDAFADMWNLRVLHYVGEIIPKPILESLRTLRGESKTLFFPNLKVLILEDFCAASSLRNDIMDSVEQLRRSLASRARKKPLPTLVILRASSFSQTFCPRLQAVVDELIWDGIEDIYEGETEPLPSLSVDMEELYCRTIPPTVDDELTLEEMDRPKFSLTTQKTRFWTATNIDEGEFYHLTQDWQILVAG